MQLGQWPLNFNQAAMRFEFIPSLSSASSKTRLMRGLRITPYVQMYQPNDHFTILLVSGLQLIVYTSHDKADPRVSTLVRPSLREVGGHRTSLW